MKAKFELPTLTPRVARATAEEKTSDQSLQPFSKTLLAASRTILEVGTLSSGGSRATGHQKAPSRDAKTTGNVAFGHAVQAPIHSLQPLPPQPVMLTQLTPVTNPIVTQTEMTFEGPVDLPDTSTIVPGDPTRNPAEITLSGSQSGEGLSSMVQPHDGQATDAQRGSEPVQTESSLPGSVIEATETPASSSSKAGSQVSSAVAARALTADQRALQSALQEPSSDALPNIAGLAAPDGTSSNGPGTGRMDVAKPVQTATQDAALNAALTLASNSASAEHSAMNVSAKGYLASTSTMASRDQAAGPAATTDQTLFAAGHPVPNKLANEFAALAELNGGLHAMAQAGMPHVNPVSMVNPLAMAPSSVKDVSEGASVEVVATSRPGQSAPDHTGSQAGSQEATPSGDQRQDSGSVQGQSAASTEINPANHTVIVVASAPGMSTATPLVALPMLAGVGGHAVIAPDSAVLAQAALPRALPVINTAKLIQSMGQSEMRVGMRSTEFGNISISTSATRDLISAQISLDHGELAKILSAHLPEVQARLGGNQAVDVRIDMNGEQARQGTGTSGEVLSSSADASRGGRQQGGNTAPRYSGTESTEQHVLLAASAMTAGDGRSNTRLDIRV